MTIQTLLDCSIKADAAACGTDQEVQGLKITFEADSHVGACLYLSKYGHSIDLYGAAEIRELIRAANLALSRTDAMSVAAIDSLFMSRAPANAPISAEQAKATRAALDAKFRAGETVMNRDARGCFTGAVKVATFGGVEVPLSRGQVALIDEVDLERVSRHNWRANPTSYDETKFYAATSIKGATVYLHRFILEAPKGLLVDHRNRDTLDCRRANLRLATRVQNNVNRRDRTAQPYRGIERKDFCRLPWNARIQVAGKLIRSGRFATPEEAARAYDAMASKHYGEFAMLNFPAEA